MIISQLVGGLGNQMFEYAVGIIAARNNHNTLKLDNLYYLDHSKRLHRFCYRPYALDLFNISAQIATPQEISQFTYPRNQNKFLFHFLKLFHKDKNVINESSINSYNDLISLPINCYLKGYFQKYEFIQHDIELLKQEFTFKNALPPTHHKMAQLIKESEESICVVFRRGDYVGHPSLDIVSMEFYQNALDFVKRHTRERIHIFVFSDDINWCKESFIKKNEKITFVDQSLTGPMGGFYFQLMMLCHHFIIPNSTYPYWAALLAPYNNKIVVAPKVWYKGQPENTTNSILPPHWIAL